MIAIKNPAKNDAQIAFNPLEHVPELSKLSP
jgi:hypothetical protein